MENFILTLTIGDKSVTKTLRARWEPEMPKDLEERHKISVLPEIKQVLKEILITCINEQIPNIVDELIEDKKEEPK